MTVTTTTQYRAIRSQPSQPALYCPIPPAINEHVETAHEHTLEWACDFNLVAAGAKDYQRLRAAKIAFAIARTYPDASLANLQMISDWLVWFCFHDDLCDTSGTGKSPERLASTNNRLLEIWRGVRLTSQDGAMSHALYNLRQRMLKKTPDLWLHRFTRSMETYFQSMLWEATNYAQDVIPRLAVYIKMRRFTINLDTFFDLICINKQINPQAAFWKHIYVQSLTEMAKNHMAWFNDIYGFRKEIQERSMHNLVLLLQHEYKLCQKAAIRPAVKMCNDEMEAFLSLASRLPLFGETEDAELKQYVMGLNRLCAGVLTGMLNRVATKKK